MPRPKVTLVVAPLLALVAACGGASAKSSASSARAGSSRTTSHQSGSSGKTAPTTTTVPAPTTTVTVPPGSDWHAPAFRLTGVSDNRVFLLGDSVMAAMNPGYTNAANKVLDPLGWKVTIDARESRSPINGIQVLRTRRKDIGQVAVILLGNNYGGNKSIWAGQVQQMLSALDGVPVVVFLTVEEYQPNRADVNAVLRDAASDPRVVLVDWNAISASVPGAIAHDGLHLNPSGATVMAQSIANAIGLAPV
jgi:hypothetical protein